jgi:penicillin-binding protein 1A
MARKGKKSSGRKKAAPKKHALLRRLLRFGFLLGLWATIVIGAVVGWYALELPQITEAPKLIEQNAVTVEGRDGTVLARYGNLQGVATPVSELPAHLVYAVLAIEDRRFYKHPGVDPIGIIRAFGRNLLEGKVAQGGSTITQQLAKNLFLSPARTFKRKVQEALLALWIEHHLTKDEILSLYLNRVFMGSRAFGVEAAAEVYFNKTAKDLTLRESATIAGLLKAPSRYSPQANPGLSAERTNVVLAAMADAGYITEDEAKNLTSIPPTPRKKPDEANSIRYFTDWVTRDLDMLIGDPELDVTVTTTIDPEIQDAAEKALATQLRESGADKNVSQGAVIVLDYDGAVLAMVGGYDYQRSQFNRATEARRQPGSSFKPFVYLTALQAGWKKDDLVMDAPITEGKYRPGNYDGKYYGEIPLRYALAFSLNTVAVKLAQTVGPANIAAVARAAGIRAPLHQELSLALGASEVPMIEMVNAFATIARDGYYLDPYAVTQVKDKKGRLLYQRSNAVTARRTLDPRAVADLKDMMTLVVREGTGRGAQGPYQLAGKTGTSQEFRDAWFIGFTDRYIAAAWVGNDDNTSMKKVTGGSLPARIFRDTITVAHGKRRALGTFFTAGNNDDYQSPVSAEDVLASPSMAPGTVPVTMQQPATTSSATDGQFGEFIRNFISGNIPAPVPTDESHEKRDRYN